MKNNLKLLSNTLVGKLSNYDVVGCVLSTVCKRSVHIETEHGEFAVSYKGSSKGQPLFNLKEYENNELYTRMTFQEVIIAIIELGIDFNSYKV